MDWVDTTDDTIEAAAALRQTFEIVRPVPTQTTARVQNLQTGKGKDRHQALLQGKLPEILHASIEISMQLNVSLRCREPVACLSTSLPK